MDPKIKEQLLKMKEHGFSYRRISFLLNIPLSNVKSTVLRARKAPVKKIYCKTCGKYVKQPKGKKEKNFCSDKCRTKWWNAHKDLIKHSNPVYKKCPICGKVFITYKSQNKIYCCRECYRRAKWVKQTNIFTD